MSTEKRKPGRPKKVEIEQSMASASVNIVREEESPVENTETPMKTAPVSRGIREANLRAEQIRSRQRDEDIDTTVYDKFYIDPRDIPDGWDYNWKRYETLGMKDGSYEVELAQAGWEPVDSARHPHMMPLNHNGPIIREGMILMERPAEISNRAKFIELQEARRVVSEKERALGMTPSGTFERDNRRQVVKKEYIPMEIPKG
jgi:hypothetical protein